MTIKDPTPEEMARYYTDWFTQHPYNQSPIIPPVLPGTAQSYVEYLKMLEMAQVNKQINLDFSIGPVGTPQAAQQQKELEDLDLPWDFI